MASETPGGVRLAKVGGVPIYLGTSWLLIAGVTVVVVGAQLRASHPALGNGGYAVAAIYALCLLVVVLVHEAAHALAARAFGLPVLRIVADLWGGHTAFDASKAGPGPFAVIAFAGPLSNAFLGMAGLVLLRGAEPGVAADVLFGFVWVNLLLAGFNLLPGLPLDGGQLVEAVVWALTGRRNQARIVAGWCGRILALALGALAALWPMLQGRSAGFATIWGLLIAVFLWRGASGAIQQGSVLQGLEALRLSELVRATVPVEMSAPVAATDPQRGVVIVLDERAVPVGLLDVDALESLHPLVRDTTAVAAVTRMQPADWVIDLPDKQSVTALVQQMQQRSLSVAAVRVAGVPQGVVWASDLLLALRRHGAHVTGA